MPFILMEQRFEAPPERVFDIMTDHVGFGRALNADVTIERQGTPPPNGLGAIRAVRARGITVREEVVRWEAPRAMDYRVIGGAPLKNHLGEIRLSPDAGGTRVDYRIRFEWPWYLGGEPVGRMIALALKREIVAGLARLADSARSAAA